MALVLLVVLILLNGFFALVEIAFVSAKRPRLEDMALKGRTGARIAPAAAQRAGAVLLGGPGRRHADRRVQRGARRDRSTRIDSQSPSPACPPLFAFADEIATAVVVLVITYLSIVVGELVPKTIALRAPERIAVAAAPVIRVVTRITAPAVAVLGFSTRLLVRALRMQGVRVMDEGDRREEILVLVRLAAARREISGEQERIFAQDPRPVGGPDLGHHDRAQGHEDARDLDDPGAGPRRGAHAPSHALPARSTATRPTRSSAT